MNPQTRRRVAVTGIGMVTPLGNDRESTWKALIGGKSGIGKITILDASGFPTRIAAEVKNFDPEAVVGDRKLLKQAGRFTAFALAAAEEALQDARVRPTASTGEQWGIVCGSGMGPIEYDELRQFQREFASDGSIDYRKLGETGSRFRSPVVFAKQQMNAAIGLLSQKYGILGYTNCVHTACASGGQALGLAMQAIRMGDVNYALAGGYDSMINPAGLSGFCLLGALSADNDTPAQASRPFDLKRNGFVLGEGGAFLVLEEWGAAVKRGAKIYAELAGEGNSLSSYRITDSHPSGDGPIQAMKAVLRDAGASPESIDYINAHGTSTYMNDICETNAIKAVFGAAAKSVPISSTKSQMGHLIAGAGAVEGAICALAIRDSILPMTANRTNPDPECDLDYIVEGPRKKPIRVALSNSFGFGGSNSCLAFRNPSLVAGDKP